MNSNKRSCLGQGCGQLSFKVFRLSFHIPSRTACPSASSPSLWRCFFHCGIQISLLPACGRCLLCFAKDTSGHSPAHTAAASPKMAHLTEAAGCGTGAGSAAGLHSSREEFLPFTVRLPVQPPNYISVRTLNALVWGLCWPPTARCLADL